MFSQTRLRLRWVKLLWLMWPSASISCWAVLHRWDLCWYHTVKNSCGGEKGLKCSHVLAKWGDRAVRRREMQTAIVNKSCAKRNSLRSLMKGDYLTGCVMEGGKMTSQMSCKGVMLIPGTTHIFLVAPKNMQTFWSGLCGTSMITNRTGLKKLQGAGSWSYAST